MKQKSIALLSQGEEGAEVRICAVISRVGTVWVTQSRHTQKQIAEQRKRHAEKYPGRQGTRVKDIVWCLRHIPSSIMWTVEIHHDWNNGGVMYLLTPEEHRNITTQERRIR